MPLPWRLKGPSYGGIRNAFSVFLLLARFKVTSLLVSTVDNNESSRRQRLGGMRSKVEVAP